MNRFVHYDLTRAWALEAGFTDAEAEEIASANWACDSRYIDLLGKRYHWGLLGAPIVSVRRFRGAVRDRDLTALGEALHSLQDTLGHGVLGHLYHWPGIDRWEQRGEGVRRRIEGWSRRMLAAYRLRVCASTASSSLPGARASHHDLIHTLNEVADAVTSAMCVEDVLDTIVARAKTITDTDKVLLLLADEHSHRLDVDTIVVRGRRAQHAQEWWEARLDQLGDIVFSAGEPIVEVHSEHGAAILASPLLVRDRPIGMLCAINSLERPFGREHLDFVQILSAFAASAIENARLAEQGRYALLASERDRIAKEMHDGVVQSLFSVTLGLELCKKQVRDDPAATAVRLDELQEQLTVAMTELRSFIYDLRPMKLTELGLVEAVDYWISEITIGRPVKGALHVEEGLPTLDPAQEACLYGVAKEAVSNVVRHAGAQSFDVRIETSGAWVRLSVADDGVGFDSALVLGGGTQGLGLKSISDRAAQDGGRLNVESAAGRGTVLTVEIPLEGVT